MIAKTGANPPAPPVGRTAPASPGSMQSEPKDVVIPSPVDWDVKIAQAREALKRSRQAQTVTVSQYNAGYNKTGVDVANGEQNIASCRLALLDAYRGRTLSQIEAAVSLNGIPPFAAILANAVNRSLAVRSSDMLLQAAKTSRRITQNQFDAGFTDRKAVLNADIHLAEATSRKRISVLEHEIAKIYVTQMRSGYWDPSSKLT